MLNLYDKMTDPQVARKIWARNIVGIHGWGLTLETHDPPTVHGGLSGSQILLFLAVDAFLGIERYHTDSQLKMQISQNLREVAASFRRHSFRRLLSEKSPDDIAIGKALDQMVKQLRVSERAPHRWSNDDIDN